MPREPGAPRTGVKSKHKTGWQAEIRAECLRRVQSEREQLLQQRRGQALQSALDSVLSDAANSVYTDHLRPDGLEEASNTSHGCLSAQAAGKGANLLRHDLLSVEEHQELMSQMEALLFDEGYRDELAAIEAAELESITELLARNAIDDRLPEGHGPEVLCPVCKKANLVESAFGYISCPEEGFTIEPPLHGIGNLLQLVSNSIASKLEQHHSTGCQHKPHFFVKQIGDTNIYLACYECGTLEVVI